MACQITTCEDKLQRIRLHLRIRAEAEIPRALWFVVDPEDVVQETLKRAWEHREQFRGSPFTVRAWLRRILLNTIRTQLVREGRRRRLLIELFSLQGLLDETTGSVTVQLAIESASPCQDVILREEGRRLKQALATLDRDERVAIKLFYFKGRTQQRIAACLGRTRGSVAGLIRRALKKLGRMLAEPANGDAAQE